MRIVRALAALFFAGAALSVQPGQSGRLVEVRPASAAVAIAYSLDELVGISSQALVVKAVEPKSLWEKVGGSRRIVTYTKLEVVETVFGKPSGELWVRTLGGAVGRIGQQVAGEAEFYLGKLSVVFLMRADDDATVVAGAAQGHFPIVEPKKKGQVRKLKLSPSLGTILPRSGPSVTIQDTLSKKPLDEALAAVRDAKARLDAHRRKHGK